MPKLPRSYIDPQWTTNELDEAVNRLSSSEDWVMAYDAVQQLRPLSVEDLTESLASTLHTISRAAKKGSKFAGVMVDHHAAQWRMRFDVSQAQEWVKASVAKHLGTLQPNDEMSAAIQASANALRLRDRIDRLRETADHFLREGDLVRASEILYGEIPDLEKRLQDGSSIYVQVGSDGGRKVLRGSDGSSWIAQRVSDVEVEPSQD